jgi:hypothetical protein
MRFSNKHLILYGFTICIILFAALTKKKSRFMSNASEVEIIGPVINRIDFSVREPNFKVELKSIHEDKNSIRRK